MMLRSSALAFAIAGTFGGGLSLAQPADTTRNPLANSPAAVAAGLTLYDQTCQACHGPAGQGDRGPALNTRRFVHGNEDGDLVHTIRAGVPGSQMPPFPRLTDEQVWQLVSYIRSLSSAARSSTRAPVKVPVSVTTRDGRELRGTRLSEDTFFLHLVDGNGDIELGQRLINGAAKKMADEFFQKFAAAVTAG